MGRPRQVLRAGVFVLVIGYLLCMLAIGAYVRVVADTSDIGTLLLFGPRWILVAPWALLLLMAWFVSRGLATIALAGTVFTAMVVSGFEIPRFPPEAAGPHALRLVTYNTDQSRTLGARIQNDMAAWNADIVILEDCMFATRAAIRTFAPLALHEFGEFCIVTSLPVERMDTLPHTTPGVSRTSVVRTRIKTARGPLDVYGVHFISPRDALTAARKLDLSRLARSNERRSANSRAVSEWVHSSDVPGIVAGDFNLPTGSAVLRRDWSDRKNAFSERGWGFGNTMFAGHYAVRIDHVFVPTELVTERIELQRGFPSEHQPLVVDLAWRR